MFDDAGRYTAVCPLGSASKLRKWFRAMGDTVSRAVLGGYSMKCSWATYLISIPAHRTAGIVV